MIRISKKALSVLCSMILAVNAVLCITVWSVDNEPYIKKTGNLIFKYIPNQPAKNECTIVNISDEDSSVLINNTSEVVIPETIDGYKVTALGDGTHSIMYNDYGNTYVETLKLPTGLRIINSYALWLPQLKDLYINISNLDSVGDDAFSSFTRLAEVYAYNTKEKAYYPTSDDLDLFREYVSIEGIKFEEFDLDCYCISKEEYQKNPKLNGRLEFITEVSCSPYTRKVAYLYALETVEKYNLNSPDDDRLHRMEKIVNYLKGHSRYAILYTYADKIEDRRNLINLSNSAVSAIGFHICVCGGYSYGFEVLCRASMGNEISDTFDDVLCVVLPEHVANAVRLEHRDDDTGYYIIDNTSSVFLQGYGFNGYTGYNETINTLKYGVEGGLEEANATAKDVKLEKAPNDYWEGVSCLYLRDETNGQLNLKLREIGSNNVFFDFTSTDDENKNNGAIYPEQFPLTKCGEGHGGGGLHFFIEPNMYSEIEISNSKGSAIVNGEGIHEFTLGNVKYECEINIVDYDTPRYYGSVYPLTAYKNYFEVIIRQLSDDPDPDKFVITTTTHKATTTTTTTTSTTTTKKPTTTSTTTTKKLTTTSTTTTKKVTTTTTPVKYLLGDVDNNGAADGSDATLVLKEYACIGSGRGSTFNKTQALAGDVDKSGGIDGSDATLILKHYALIGAGFSDDWNLVLKRT